MKRLLVKGLAATAIAATIPVVFAASPAHADCDEMTAAFALNPDNSAIYNASAACNGLVVEFAWNVADSFRGQYYTGSGWVQSTLGWKWVTPLGGGSTDQKIIGDTVTGRLLRGEAKTQKQNVFIKF